MLKPIRIDSSFTTVSILDSAIDYDSPENKADEYIKEFIKKPNGWRDKIKFKAGESPTVFTIGVIPSEQMNRIQDSYLGKDETKESQLKWDCFLWSVRNVEGFDEQPRKKMRGSVEYVDPEWLREKFSRNLRMVALEIGLRAWLWNNLQDDDIKN